MNASIPAITDIRGALKALSHAEMQGVADRSGVPFTTLLKIRTGATENPGIETVRKFMPHIGVAVEQG